jgi:hypothetical protein
MDFRIKRRGKGLSVAYLDFGKWYPVPADYRFDTLAAELLSLVQDKDRNTYEVRVINQGIVSVDYDRQLLLTNPAPAKEDS